MVSWQRLNSRWLFFSTVSICLSFVLIARLLDLQLYQGALFRVKADDNRFFTLTLPTERGVFLDRYAQPLVWNTRRYFEVSNTTNLHQTRTPIERDKALSLMATQSASVVATLERTYRFPEAFSHVLGFVGSVTAEDLAKKIPVTMQEQLGKLGLELTQQSLVRGLEGKERYEINALGLRQKKVATIAPTAGENVQTTLDPYLSEVAYRALGGQKGAVVILDASTGEVLSLVSSPAFDANVLTTVAVDPVAAQSRKETIQRYFSDPQQLFFNRAIDGVYPPGSVFKPIVALAGLESDKIDGTTVVVDEGTLKVGEYEYGNWYYRQYGRTEGPLSLVKALARSNDIYFYKAAEAAGPDRVARMARMFGLGLPTGIELRPQASGLVPDPAWKEKRLGEQWYLGNTYHYGIGQGDLLVSPIQMAQATQAMANEGVRCPPTLLKKSARSCTELGLKTENVSLVLEGMLDACSSGGTAFPFFEYNTERRVLGGSVESDLAAGAMACKTGTAEFGAADANDHRKTHGWFVAILGTDQKMLTGNEEESLVSTSSAQLEQVKIVSHESELRAAVSRSEWLSQIQATGFPKKLVFVALVEGDTEHPFREGSADAAPVVKKVVDWMEGR